MNLMTGESADAFFGGEVPPAVRALLHQAALAPPAARAALLWTAQALAPDTLAIYHALYKHHAGRREFALAARAAERALLEAARLAGLDADWRRVQPGDGGGFEPAGPARFWLFTLKALAFIRLRAGEPAAARQLLAQIERLDGGARVGHDVVAQMLASAEADEAARGAGRAGAGG